MPDSTEKPLKSVVFAFDDLDDPRLWIPHDRAFHASPHPAHRSKKGFRLASSLELQIDHHVVRFIHRARDLVVADTRLFAIDGIVVEGLLPNVAAD